MEEEEMDKKQLLKELANNGLRVGLGAKKHFASYDIIQLFPGYISMIGLLIGVCQLSYPNSEYSSGISTILIIASILALSISSHAEKESYNRIGKNLTKTFNKLRVLYYKVENSDEKKFTSEVQAMRELLNRAEFKNRSEQIFGSDLWAHYKFFSSNEIDWITEQKNFKAKDKVPKSFIGFVFICLLVWFGWFFTFNKGGAILVQVFKDFC
ncbi:SLATT domain-containing protein [Peribacillus frigoritolerans]|uniref:SLATT domain-containing protein n=1 Tax=Peribacillus frigoritolerans TaxID=450367 RepID=UPI0021A78220|nr:SLATT domain-containing protein [Peribacillus frigoritolerans]MCT1391426.1 SLATT domain-containing protein [Peribacillus frigoritolerans]